MDLKKMHAVVLRTLAAPIVNHVLSVGGTFADSVVELNLFPKESDFCLGRLMASEGEAHDWMVFNAELVQLLAHCANDRCDLVTASRSWKFAQTVLPNVADWGSRAQKNMFLVLSHDSIWREHVAGSGSSWKKMPAPSNSSRGEIFTLKSDTTGYELAVAFVSSGDDAVTQALAWGRDFWLCQKQSGVVFVDGCASTALWTDQDVIHDHLSELALRGFDVFCVAVPVQEISAVDKVSLKKSDKGIIEFCIRDEGSSGIVNFSLHDGRCFPFVLAEVPFQSTLSSALSGGLMQVTRQGSSLLAENEWWFRFAMPQDSNKLSKIEVAISGAPKNKFLLSNGSFSHVSSVGICHDFGNQDWVICEYDRNGARRAVGADRLKSGLSFF